MVALESLDGSDIDASMNVAVRLWFHLLLWCEFNNTCAIACVKSSECMMVNSGVALLIF